jgi:hypothetical protein
MSEQPLSVYNATTYEEQTTLTVEFENSTETIDVADSFMYCTLDKQYVLDYTDDQATRILQEKIFSQAILIDKLSAKCFTHGEFVRFCQSVLYATYGYDQSITIAELRDVIQDYLPTFTAYQEDDIEQSIDSEYSALQKQILTAVQDDELYNELYFSLLYSGLTEFCKVIDEYQETKPSQLLEEYELHEPTQDITFSNRMYTGVYLLTSKDSIQQPKTILSEYTEQELHKEYAKVIPSFIVTQQFHEVISSYCTVLSETDLTLTDVLLLIGEHIVTTEDILTEESYVHKDFPELPDSVEELFQNYSTLEHNIFMYSTYNLFILHERN